VASKPATLWESTKGSNPMASYTIKSNNRARQLFYACEVSYNEREAFRREFDWMDQEEFDRAMFFKYRGEYYALAQFLRVEGDLLAKGWQGQLGETAYSSLLIKIKDSCQSVIVGRYYC
jgi:hypothetical protein